MCSDPLGLGGEAGGCFVGCTLAMSDMSPCSLHVHREFPELKNNILKRVCFRCGEILFFFLLFFSSNAHGLLQV